jgi:hypothetical protein
MEIWNREELYAEVWEQPLVKIAPKYEISAVAQGRVCQKLQIPLKTPMPTAVLRNCDEKGKNSAKSAKS